MQQDAGLRVLETSEKQRIRTILLDSDLQTVERLQEILKQDPDVDVLGSSENAFDAISLIRSTKPDLMFLGTQIDGMDAFTLLESLRGGPSPEVILMTSSERFALQAFEVSAVDFLVKPLLPERVRRALAKVKALFQPRDRGQNGQPLERLAIRSGKKVFFLRPDEIDWIEAEGNSVQVHSGPECHALKMSITTLEKGLDPHLFARIHRSTIVNINRIRWIEPSLHGTYRVVLHDGTQLVMSRKEKLSAMTGKTIRSRAE